MINSRWLKIFGPLLINNRYIGLYLERILSPVVLIWKWCNKSSFNQLSPEIQNLAGRAITFAGKKTEKPRDIIFVNRFFMQGQIGGVNFLIALMAFGLKGRGHRVRILCESPRPWPVTKFYNGVEIVGIKPRLLFLSHSSPPFYAAWSKAVETYLRLIQRENHNVNVFATIAGLETLGTEMLPSEINSICYLVTDHIIHKFGIKVKPAKGNRIDKFLNSERAFLMSPRIQILADSNAIVSDLSSVLSLSDLSAKATVLYIGWPKNDELFNLELPIGRIVTCIGSVSFRKGTRTLIDAWLSICSDPVLADSYLLICGPTSDDHESESIIMNAPVTSRIKRIKNMSEAEKTFILSKTDLVVIPSNYESFGIVGVEAMQQGCQIIASRVGGLSEVLEGVAKFFNPGASNELAIAIKSVLSGNNLTPSEEILARAEAFNFETMLQELEMKLT